VFLVLAYMIFKQLMKAFVIGIISAAIPIVLYLMGFEIELSIQTIIWFGLAGIAIYFVYDVLSGWMHVIKILTWPFRAVLRRSKKDKKEKQAKEKKDKKKEEKKEKEERPKKVPGTETTPEGSSKDSDYVVLKLFPNNPSWSSLTS
jgi:hypothetical protein